MIVANIGGWGVAIAILAIIVVVVIVKIVFAILKKIIAVIVTLVLTGAIGGGFLGIATGAFGKVPEFFQSLFDHMPWS